MKPTTTLSALVTLTLGAASASAAIVYEDNFDNDGLGTNAGTGGGMTTTALRDATRNTFDDTGNLASGPDGNAASRAVASTINAFDVSGGFTLTVNLVGSTNGNGYFDVSLTQANLAGSMTVGDEGIFTTFGGAADGNNGNSYYGAGIEFGSWYAGNGIAFNDGTANGSTSVQLVDFSAGPWANDSTIALTVNPDDSWSYTVNGSPAASGADFVAGPDVIDLSAPMYVNAFSQPQATIDSIKLTALGSASAPQITSITSVGVDLWELTLKGEASTGYEFYSDPTMAFDPGTLILNLLQDDPGSDAGTVDGDDDEVLITDGNGDGKVQVTLSGTQNLIRAQTAP